MKKRFWWLLGVLAVLLALAACDSAIYEPMEYIETEDVVEYTEVAEILEYFATPESLPAVEEVEAPVVAVAQAMAEVATEAVYEAVIHAHYFDVFSSGRTRGEYLEDFDHLYSTLAANFPFFGVIYRSHGVDLHELYRQTRQYIETTRDIRSDQQFATLIDNRFISPARGAGHFDMLTGNTLQRHIEVFSNHVYRVNDQFLYFLYELDNPATRALHGLTDDHFAPPEPGRMVGLAWRRTSPRKVDFLALGTLISQALGLKKT